MENSLSALYFKTLKLKSVKRLALISWAFFLAIFISKLRPPQLVLGWFFIVHFQAARWDEGLFLAVRNNF